VDFSRLVDVSARTPGGRVSFGSGFVVAPGLVLTARHVVCGDDGKPLDEPHVRFTGDGAPWQARIVWPGRPDLDAALLQLGDAAPSLAPVRWGQLIASETGVGCEAAGFPASMQQEDRMRDLEQMRGEINAGTGLLGHRIYADVKSAIPRQGGWAGMSGAALWCGPLLVGVVAWDPEAFGTGRLAAEPVTRLFDDRDFRALIGENVPVEAVGVPGPGPRVKPLTPAFLLRADAETARFRSRAQELAELLSWCDGDGLRVWLLTGPGGQGKTRLARELADRLAASRRWATSLMSEGVRLPADIRVPLLAIVDYAETRPEQVAEIIVSALAQPGHTPIRVLLLARSMGDWWERLRKQTALLDNALAGATTSELTPLDDTSDGRTRAFTEALTDYSAALVTMGWPCEPPDRVTVPDLAGERFGSALRLQMSALAALLGSSAVSEQQVEEVILGHEARYWEHTATQHGVRVHEQTLRRAVAAAALCGAGSETEALALLGCLPGLRDQDEDVRLRAARWLRDLYPAAALSHTPAVGPDEPAGYWGSLQPDLLTEHLVGSVVAAAPPDLLPSLLKQASADQEHQALTVLSRSAATRPRIAAALADLLTVLPGLAPAAVRVATQSEHPSPLVAALTGLAEKGDLPIPLMSAITGAIPPSTQALARFAIIIEEKLLAARERAADADPDGKLPDIAASLSSLSVRLHEAGREEEALAAAERTVSIYERLADQGSDAYLPALASALRFLATRLAAWGRPREGRAAIDRAVAIGERLAKADPDAYLPDLAMSLNNLAWWQEVAGRQAEALETTERVVAVYEPLARADAGAYLPYLATALSNLSHQLAGVGRNADALAAIERATAIREGLAEANPDAYLLALAWSLDDLSIRLAEAGAKVDTILAVIERALAIRERLETANPDADLPDLAFSQSNLFFALAGTSGETDPVATIERVVHVVERAAQATPLAYLPGLATALNNISMHLAEAGQAAAGLALMNRSLAISEHVAALDPRTFTDDLVVALAESWRPAQRRG
jgi:hypothetical protein